MFNLSVFYASTKVTNMENNRLREHLQERMPVFKEEIQDIMEINNENSLNQALSFLISFNILKRFENGIYYLPSEDHRFAHLQPSLKDVVYKKYLDNDNGIMTGAYLLYKYKFTTQVSSYYEILFNNVSSKTRSKKEYEGKVSVSHPKVPINKESIHYIEFIELVKYLHFSDLNDEENYAQLKELLIKMKLEEKKLVSYVNHYNGRRYSRLRVYISKIINNETS